MLEDRQSKGDIHASYRNNTRYSPFDGIHLNRLFPGSTEGIPTLQLARALWEETRDDEYLIDLHICGVSGSTYTLALYKEYPDLRELANALVLPIVIRTKGCHGGFFHVQKKPRRLKASSGIY